MNEMLGKLVKLIVTVPAEWLGTLVDLCEKLVSKEGASYLENVKLVLRKENVVWEKVREVYTILATSYLSLSDSTEVKVHQLVKRATFDQMFRGLEEESTTLDDLCMSEDQREKFIEEHRDQFPRGSRMLFLHKEGGKFLVARVCRHSAGHLARLVAPLSDVHVWDASHVVRLVVPQRTIKSSVP